MTEEKRLSTTYYSLLLFPLFFFSFFFFFLFSFFEGKESFEYHCLELLQVSFLSRQTHDKTRLLSRQKRACRDKTFVKTKSCLSPQNLSRQIFLATKLLSRETYFSHEKKTCMLSGKILSRQKYFVEPKK